MNADHSYSAIGQPERMVYRFSIIGYLFGRELYRKTFWCDNKKRGTIFAENYVRNRLTNIACDRYRVEVFDGVETETLFGGHPPKKAAPWKEDDAETLRSFSTERIHSMRAANQAGWKERLHIKRARGK